MGDGGEIIMLPMAFIFMAVMDYAAWSVFQQVAGGWAVLYMAGLVFFELVAIARMANS